ncbi:MAG: poly-gamma-glutamate system protein [Candidatus Cloacimonetes bacterium]|nr:poly-gamma-glutamate system protein [Candidatus Cloacimonadota bacterium]
MFKPSLRSIWSLLALAALAVALYYIAQSQYVEAKDKEKLEAAELMSRCMEALKDEVVASGYHINERIDPAQTGLVGPRNSSITTSAGILSNKITTLNPNFAAVYVDLLRQAGVHSGDWIAVGLTGAEPGANLALYCAMQTIDVNPVIITAVGAAEFGANREDFTWLDMERVLYQRELIGFGSVRASLGGFRDLGHDLDSLGVANLLEAMKRNKVPLIRGRFLSDNVLLRREIYDEALAQGRQYALFVNIGAGAANVGDFENAKAIRTGLNTRLAEQEFETPGVMMEFAKTMPVLHIYHIRTLADRFGMPVAARQLPEVGEGAVFESRALNVTVAIICLAIILLAITVVVIFDRKDRHFLENVIDPDKEL